MGIGVVRLDWRHRWFLRSGDKKTLPDTEKKGNSGRARCHRCGFRAPARADRRSAVPGRPRDSARVGVRRCAVLWTARADQRSAFPGRPRISARWALPRCTVLRTARADQRSAFPCGRRHLDRWGSRAGLHSDWPEVGRRRIAERENNNGGEPPVRRPRDRGESVKGGHPPFHKKKRPIGTRRSAPPAHEGVSIAGAKRRAVRERGLKAIRLHNVRSHSQ